MQHFRFPDVIEYPDTECETTTVTLRESETGVLYSPGYGAFNYPDEAFCVWTFEAPENKVRSGALQKLRNYL